MKERIFSYYKAHTTANCVCGLISTSAAGNSRHNYMHTVNNPHKNSYTESKPYAFDQKTKTLLQLALANVLECPVCTKTHLKNALASGATRQELTETLFLAALDNPLAGKLAAQYKL